jgi:hypothetical protein
LHLTEAEKKNKKFVFFKGWGVTGGPLVDFLSWLGISESNIFVCTKNVIFNQLTIPSFGWMPWNHAGIFLDREFYRPLRMLSKYADRHSNIDVYDKVYLSRGALSSKRTLPPPYGGYNARILAQATSEAIDADLGKRGFTTVFPERLSVLDQVRVIANAKYIVGPGGSANHLAGFAYQAAFQIILTTERFWMLNTDSVFAWDKGLELSYVFGTQSDLTVPALKAPWDFDMRDWNQAADAVGL